MNGWTLSPNPRKVRRKPPLPQKVATHTHPHTHTHMYMHLHKYALAHAHPQRQVCMHTDRWQTDRHTHTLLWWLELFVTRIGQNLQKVCHSPTSLIQPPTTTLTALATRTACRLVLVWRWMDEWMALNRQNENSLISWWIDWWTEWLTELWIEWMILAFWWIFGLQEEFEYVMISVRPVCMMVVLIEFYAFIPLSVTITVVQGLSSVEQLQLKILCSLPIKLKLCTIVDYVK